MKYFTKEWYEACQAADWCLNMAVSKNAEEFSEEYYKDCIHAPPCLCETDEGRRRRSL